MLPTYTSFAKILEATNRIPFTNHDGAELLSYLKAAGRNGLDILVHPIMKGTIQESFDEGIIVLTSAALERDFVVIKIDGGHGFFGKQKANFMFYVGRVESDELMPGATFRSFARAITSINNIYRGAGLLRGPAL